jgi:hypothetical protein
MGNVFKLIRNWLSSQPDDDAKNVTHLDQSSCISTDPPVYSWLVRLLALHFGCHHYFDVLFVIQMQGQQI